MIMQKKSKAGAGLACLLEIYLPSNKNLKSYKCRQKKFLHFLLEFLQESMTVGSFTWAEFFLFP